MVNNSNHVQEGKVFWTTDLSKFVSLNGNRVVNPKHVERLENSIKLNGVLINPIIVNSLWEIVDGQHRLEAAKRASTGIYYIVAAGYSLKEVHALNLNQKNWGTKDYLEGYANMGLTQYVKLNKFMGINNEFTIAIAIAICSKDGNTRQGCNLSTTFNAGKWEVKDWNEAQNNADKLKLIGNFYEGFVRRSFVVAILDLLKNERFDFNEFMHKLRLQPNALIDCVNATQYKILIEDIYNYRNRNKVSFKY